MSKRQGAPLLVAACLLVPAACTGGAEDTGAGADAEDPAAVDCTTSPESEDGLTAPGQVLCLGTPATVPVMDQGATGVVELTVEAVRELPEKERLKFDQSPFYGSTFPSSEYDVHLVRYSVKVVSEDEEGAFTGSDTVFDVAWSNVQPWAEEVDSPVGLGPTGCRSADHARGQAPGTDVSGCEWAFVRGDVQGARFWNATAGYHPQSGGDYVYWK